MLRDGRHCPRAALDEDASGKARPNLDALDFSVLDLIQECHQPEHFTPEREIPQIYLRPLAVVGIKLYIDERPWRGNEYRLAILHAEILDGAKVYFLA
ncbi:MAG TPA: hypothetical protein VME43_27550 [Bryobacteraceae bacterium]|nr:hypothetical protein [Bryobacteraceae bacterium]